MIFACCLSFSVKTEGQLLAESRHSDFIILKVLNFRFRPKGDSRFNQLKAFR